MTFSIAAYDPSTGDFGVAVASKFLAVGAVVPWARAGMGAIATQAHANFTFGPDGLALLAQGKNAQETLAQLLAADTLAHRRQVGIVDRHGGSAAHTGSGCSAYASHRLGEGFSVQGNLLAGPAVLDSMVEAFASASGELADRLLTALIAGDEAGGDKRGKQGAALLVARPNGGYGGNNDHYLDLRVDDHPQAARQLAELVNLHHLYFGRSHPDDLLPIDEHVARELQHFARTHGAYSGPVDGLWNEQSKTAFEALIGSENLEERWSSERDADRIDRVALEFLRKRFG